MASYKTKIIILNRQDYNEADRILTVFDASRGLHKIIAKGSRKNLAHLGGKVELFYNLSVQLVEGKTWDILTDAQIISSYDEIYKNLSKSTIAYRVSRLVIQLIRHNNPHPKIYFLIEKTLFLINNEKETLAWSYLLSGLLIELGYSPDLQSCSFCNKNLALPVKWHQERGMVHSDCSELGIDLTDEEAKVIKLIIEDNDIIVRLSLSSDLINSINDKLVNFLAYHTDIDLKRIFKE